MTVRVEDSPGVAVLTLDRPPVNALDLDTILALEATFKSLADRAPLAVVLTGAGRAFSAGVDTRAFAETSREDRARQVLAISRMIAALYALPVPVVAAVNGHALGGGFVLMLACDARLCTPDPAVKLGLTEARAGVPFPAGPIEILKAELGADLTRRLALSGAVLTPAEMTAAGAIDRLVEAEVLVATACEMARDMASQPAFAVVKAQLKAATAAKLAAIAASGEDPLIAVLEAEGKALRR